MKLLSENVQVDTDTNLNFEIPNLSRKIRNFILVPILNNLPAKLLPLVSRTHPANNEIVKYKTEHTALEILYQNGSSFSSKNIFQKISFWIWFGLDNPRAVRNRLRIVKREIQQYI